MPRRRRHSKRRVNELTHDQEAELLIGPRVPIHLETGEPAHPPYPEHFDCEDERREAWEVHRERLTADRSDEQGPCWAEEYYG